MNGDPTIGEVGRTVARLESKVDRWLEDHEHRLRSCEKFKYAFPPTIFIALAGLVTAIVQWTLW